MPRLSHPRLIKGEAVACLLELYWSHPDFTREVQRLRQPYIELLSELAIEQVRFWLDCRQALPAEDYKKVLDEYYYQYALKRGRAPDFPANLSCRLEEIEQRAQKLQPYLDSLSELAYKWKLRARWAVYALLQYDLIHMASELFKVPKEIEVPLDAFDDWQPWPPPTPPLLIKISSLAYVYLSREQIIKQIAKQVREHEARVKDTGLRERPSSLQKHAKWWFEHYICGIHYDEIAQKETYTPGGSLISYARNVGNAVRKFSKLIGINPKVLK